MGLLWLVGFGSQSLSGYLLMSQELSLKLNLQLLYLFSVKTCQLPVCELQHCVDRYLVAQSWLFERIPLGLG